MEEKIKMYEEISLKFENMEKKYKNLEQIFEDQQLQSENFAKFSNQLELRYIDLQEEN